MTIPRYTKRAHFMPYWYGDSLWAIDEAKAKHYRYIDQNGRVLKNGVAVVAHWGRPWQDGYRYYWTGKKDRKGREIRRPWRNAKALTDNMTWAQYSRLRMTLHEDKSRKSRKKPTSYSQHVKYAKARGIIITYELKGSRGFESPAMARAMYRVMVNYNTTVYIMTLQNIPRWNMRLKNMHDVGFETALLPRGKQPRVWPLPYVDRVWGRFQK